MDQWKFDNKEFLIIIYKELLERVPEYNGSYVDFVKFSYWCDEDIDLEEYDSEFEYSVIILLERLKKCDSELVKYGAFELMKHIKKFS